MISARDHPLADRHDCVPPSVPALAALLAWRTLGIRASGAGSDERVLAEGQIRWGADRNQRNCPRRRGPAAPAGPQRRSETGSSPKARRARSRVAPLPYLCSVTGDSGQPARRPRPASRSDLGDSTRGRRGVLPPIPASAFPESARPRPAWCPPFDPRVLSVDLETSDGADQLSKAQAGGGHRRSGPAAHIVAIAVVRSRGCPNPDRTGPRVSTILTAAAASGASWRS
jgi:hypothetical protein